MGARAGTLVWSVVAQVAFALGCGIAAGLAGGLYAAQFVAAFLFEVRPLELHSLALPLGVLLAAATIAAVTPAIRAARVDPIVTLRYE
jgi:ABC-type antimicrobial peptide transport system permease subunit